MGRGAISCAGIATDWRTPARARVHGTARCGAPTRPGSASAAIQASPRPSRQDQRACGSAPMSGCAMKCSRQKCWPTKPSRSTPNGCWRGSTSETQKDILAMSETNPALPAENRGTEITRFNALRHGLLSRYTVLPWEDEDEYRDLIAALVAEHAPQGPTEEHLVEELAGILWRKRRLRLADAAAHRRGLGGTLASYRETVKMALVHLDATDQSERVVDAIRATGTDTEEDMRAMEEVEPRPPTPTACFASWRPRRCRGSRPGRGNWPTGP